MYILNRFLSQTFVRSSSLSLATFSAFSSMANCKLSFSLSRELIVSLCCPASSLELRRALLSSAILSSSCKIFSSCSCTARSRLLRRFCVSSNDFSVSSANNLQKEKKIKKCQFLRINKVPNRRG